MNFGRRHRLKRLDSDLILKEHDRGVALQHDEAPGVQQSVVETKGDREKRQYVAPVAPVAPVAVAPVAVAPVSPAGACVGILLCVGR
uniref:Uncharacterized protein n=1 Tax=Acrobeloides nanus TaxID=290746 RepID=A0A914CGH6_9BILA